MRCLVGIDDTDSSRGYCTTYLAYRIACDLRPAVVVLPYPNLVRLNPNIPFKTRGNAAVRLLVETSDADLAFGLVSAKVKELSDVRGGANSGLVFLDDSSTASKFEPLYLQALTGLVSPHRVRRLVREVGARSLELGNGMGLVGAASSLGFSMKFDHTFELIAYRRKESWGTRRQIDNSSVREMTLGPSHTPSTTTTTRSGRCSSPPTDPTLSSLESGETLPGPLSVPSECCATKSLCKGTWSTLRTSTPTPTCSGSSNGKCTHPGGSMVPSRKSRWAPEGTCTSRLERGEGAAPSQPTNPQET